MRGKEALELTAGHSCRITPAYAGKRHTHYQGVGGHQDHPRVCGEKRSCFCASARASGSPPRMRGKGGDRAVPAKILGITPAYAGKSTLKRRRRPVSRDHPRVCGEKWESPRSILFGMGSPPRMRGKVFVTYPATYLYGITPAYAGKSTWERWKTLTKQDHPRVCGEKTKKIP